MDTARYLVRLLELHKEVETTTVFLCEATDETNAMEQAENQYPCCGFLSCERIEYPE